MKKEEQKLRDEILNTLPMYIQKAKELNISNVGCREFYKDGSSTAFCSYEGWYEIKIDEVMKTEMSIHYSQELLGLKRNSFNYVIRSFNTAKNQFLKELALKDMCNSLIIYRKINDVICGYSFISPSSHLTTLDIFVNKISEFQSLVDSYCFDIHNIFMKTKYNFLRTQLFTDKMIESIFNNNLDINKVDKKQENLINKEGYYFTLRELELIPLLGKGASNKEIAQKLGIGIKTAEYHVGNIKTKLHTNSRFAAGEIIRNKINI